MPLSKGMRLGNLRFVGRYHMAEIPDEVLGGSGYLFINQLELYL